MKIVQNLAKHVFFSERSRISTKRYTEQETVLYLLMIAKDGSTGFSSKELKAFVDEFRGQKIPEELLEKVNNSLDYLYIAFDEKKKYLKKLNLPVIFATSVLAIEQDVSPENFGAWVDGFFKGLERDSIYTLASQSGSAKRENVQKRLRELLKSFYECFNLELKAEA